MKRLFMLLLTVILCFITLLAFSENIDLSGLSFDELVALRERLNLAIWASEEWQEVTVPQGYWTVGEDIPAGKWTIKCANVDSKSITKYQAEVKWGFFSQNTEVIKASPEEGGGYAFIANPENKFYKDGDTTEVIANLEDGMVVLIGLNSAPVVFSPYAGGPLFNFK